MAYLTSQNKNDSLVNSLSSNLLKTDVVNHSVDGATTVHIAEAVSNYRIETNFRNVRQVVVEGGINDLLQGNRESIGRSYQSVLGTVPDITPVLIIGIYPSILSAFGLIQAKSIQPIIRSRKSA